MTIFEAIFLGVLQGITEFLPVSSSGHLTLAEKFLGYDHGHEGVLFSVVLHGGTLCAIFVGLRSHLFHWWSQDRATFLRVGVATLPLFPLVLVAKPLQETFGTTWALGLCFLITSSLLLLGERWGRGDDNSLQSHSYRRALAIGCVQALAIFPGLSRSGSTISIARMLGWSRRDAVHFSFTMAIPAICGAIGYEGLKVAVGKTTIASTLPWQAYLLGFGTAFLVGLISFRLIRYLAEKGGFAAFGWYCMVLGILTLMHG